jgi:hypothetical protein
MAIGAKTVRVVGAIALSAISLAAQSQTPPAPAPAAPPASAQTPPVSSTPVLVDDLLRARIAQGGLAFGVPVSLAVACRQAGGPNQIQLGFEAGISVNAPRPLSIMFAIVDRGGRVLNAGTRIVSDPAETEEGRLTFAMPITPGLYKLRLAVADAVGRIGAAETDVAGFLTPMGSVRVSDVLMAWSRPDGQYRFLGLPEAPARTNSVRVSLEIYNDAPPADRGAQAWAVQFTLTGEHDTTPAFDQKATATGPGAAVAASVVLPIDKLPSGLYTLRASVLNGANALGSVTRQLRVE